MKVSLDGTLYRFGIPEKNARCSQSTCILRRDRKEGNQGTSKANCRVNPDVEEGTLSSIWPGNIEE